MDSRKTLTTDSGAPVTDNQNSRTAGPSGPVLIEDHYSGDTHRYRLGANHMRLPVNQPHAAHPSNYSRDGAMRTDGNHGREKNYEPNSFGGPQQTGQPLWAPIDVAGLTGNHMPVRHRGRQRLRSGR